MGVRQPGERRPGWWQHGRENWSESGCISEAKAGYVGGGLAVGCARERGANGYYKDFSLSVSKMEVLFSRWIARGADCQGGRGGRRESD